MGGAERVDAPKCVASHSIVQPRAIAHVASKRIWHSAIMKVAEVLLLLLAGCDGYHLINSMNLTTVHIRFEATIHSLLSLHA